MEALIKRFQDCPCGKPHALSVKEVFIKSGALLKLPSLLQAEGLHYPCILCDDNTYAAAGKQVEALLPAGSKICLSPHGLHADEKAVEKILSALPPEADVLLAVGAGTIHDIARYAAFLKGIPFFSVPTAASVDGFVSTVAAMSWHGFKKTLPAKAPLYVVADSSIFAEAPYRLTASGVADLLGKYTAIADWRIAHLITGEYLCPRVCRLMEEALSKASTCLEELPARHLTAFEELMHALVLSGLAMQLVGNSRPASGAEHHLSHFWEMEVINGHLEALHGEKVGVGLLAVSKVYACVKNQIRKGTCRVSDYSGLPLDALKQLLRPEAYPLWLEENTPDPLASIDPARLTEKLPELSAILDTVPSPEELDRILLHLGAARTMAQIGLEEHLRKPSLMFSPFVRNRLTGMRLLKRLEFDTPVF